MLPPLKFTDKGPTMTPNQSQLLNITTVRQILQLQAKLPGFLANQLTQLEERWPLYVQELNDDVAIGNFTAAADICHKIKGHTGLLGLKAVHELASDLENSFRHDSDFSSDSKQSIAMLTQIFQASLKEMEPLLDPAAPI